MTTSRRLWYDIEAVFSDIQRLCREARAQEIKAKARVAKKDWVLGAKKRVAPEEPKASPHDPQVTEEVPVLGQALGAGFGATFGGAEPATTAGALLPEAADGADVVALRAEIRRRLLALKSKLQETLTEREVYYSLFPIVVYADELVRSAVDAKAAAWLPLQHELYEIDNGGELFYQVVETLLKKEETLPLVFEIFYFCLNDGFVGMYPNDPAKVEDYRVRLSARIPAERPEVLAAPSDSGAAEVELVEFPRWYYVAASLAVVLIFGLLRVLSYVELTALQ